jgi:hypothetical protein
MSDRNLCITDYSNHNSSAPSFDEEYQVFETPANRRLSGNLESPSGKSIFFVSEVVLAFGRIRSSCPKVCYSRRARLPKSGDQNDGVMIEA